jgi:hypothetical protein
MDCLYRSNAENARYIHTVVLSDDVSDDNSIDDGIESDGGYVELRVAWRVQEMLHWMMFTEMK